MKIAITGASGFIGQHVLSNLLAERLDTIVIARQVNRLPKLHKSVKAVEIDISNPPIDIFERIGRPDLLIHLAWAGLPNYKSLHHFESELITQYQFLKLMIESGLTSLLVTGTCFEYGMQSGKLHEDLETRPTNPYGFAKDSLRNQLQYLQEKIPFNLTWARVFYLYGEGQANNAIYSQLIRSVERGDRYFNMSGGEQLRDYLSINEAAKYIVSLAKIASNNGIVNVCSGNPISIRKLVESWLEINGWSIDLNLGFYPYTDYEPMAFWGDRNKLNQCLRSNDVSL